MPLRGSLGHHISQWRPWSGGLWPWRLLTIFPQAEPQQIGDRQKAFSEDNRFLLVWDVSSVVIKEKR